MIPLRDDNPTTIKPVVTAAIIALAIVVFLWQLSLSPGGGERAVYALGVIPAVLFGDRSLPPGLASVPPAMTLITSMFLHGGWLHLIGNMLYLWIFGNNIEDSMGHVRFVIFYTICGVAAALTQALLDVDSSEPMIGASGAIAGVLGTYLMLFPRAHVLVLLPLGLFSQIVRLPALLVLGFWFVLQFIQGSVATGLEGEGGVAYWAHVGGFIAGVGLIFAFRRGRPRFLGGWRRGPWG